MAAAFSQPPPPPPLLRSSSLTTPTLRLPTHPSKKCSTTLPSTTPWTRRRTSTRRASTCWRTPPLPPTTCSRPSAASNVLRPAVVNAIISPWVRNSGGVFDVAFEHVEPGGSTITGGSGGRAGRLPAYATRVPVSRQSSRSSDSDIDGETDAPDMPSSASPCVLRGDFSLKAAADVQMDLFPHGIPSQGVIKSGLACISASVLFRAPACRPSLPWEGFIVDDVLFVRVPLFAASGAQFRTAVMALLELAEDVLHCASIMIAVPKTPSPISSLSSADAASLVRAFMYAGFDLVSPMLYQPAEEYVLLGYDAM